MKFGDEAVRRPVVELVRGRVLLEHAEVHDGDLVGHAHRLDLVVGHVDHRLADLVLDPLELGAHVRAEGGVEVRERLVEQEDRRLDDHASAERDLLHVVDRQARRVPVERRGQPDRVRDRAHLAVELLLRQPVLLLHPQPEGEVLVDRHVGEDRVVLEDEADVAVARVELRDRDLVEVDLAARSAARGPEIMFMVVVLPQPEGPSSAVNDPWSTSRSSCSTACRSPKCFVRLSSVIFGHAATA